MSRSLKDLVIDQLEFRETRPVPYSRLTFCKEIAEKMDKYHGSDAWRNTIQNATVEIGGLCLVPHDPDQKDTYVDEYGITWKTGTGAMHIEHAPLENLNIKALKLPDVDAVCPDEYLKKIDTIVTANSDKFTMANFGFGVFERTWTLRGFENSLLDCVAEPEFFEDLVSTVAEHQLSIVRKLVQTSVDAIMFSDDWSDQKGVIIGPERWRKVFKHHIAKLYEVVRRAGKYRISHCCGNTKEIIPDLIEIGLNCLQSVQPEAVSPYELKKLFKRKMAFWGGLGSQSTIPLGTPDDIRKEVRRLCAEMGNGGGYILGAAKEILSDTPIKNAFAVLEAFNEELSRK